MGWAWLLANGVGLGLGAAAPIGPVNVEIARRTLRFGRGAGLALGCGAVTIDVGYAVAASLASGSVLGLGWVRVGLGLAGGIFLGYLAFLCFRSFWRPVGSGPEAVDQAPAAGTESETREAGATSVPATPAGAHYVHGLLMTALNPMTVMFWLVGVPGAVAELTPEPRRDLPLVCAGVFVGALAWVIFFTSLIGAIGRFGGQRWLRWVDFGGGLMLTAYALRAIWRVVQAAG